MAGTDRRTPLVDGDCGERVSTKVERRGHTWPVLLAVRPDQMAHCPECGRKVWWADGDRVWRPLDRNCVPGRRQE